MLNVNMVCFCWFHFLNVTSHIISYHSGRSLHVYPDYSVAWVDVGGGCYRVVSEHGSPLRLDGMCVGHAFMSVAYVFLILVVHVLIEFA